MTLIFNWVFAIVAHGHAVAENNEVDESSSQLCLY